MSETKFTPGPWIKRGKGTIETSGGAEVASVMDGQMLDRVDHETQEANAHLIAAAPEIYGVVEKLAKWNKDYPSARVYGYGDIKQIAEEMDAINAQAIAALAKARGEA